MTSDPALKIHRGIQRASDADIESLKGTPTGFVCDAMGRAGAMHRHIAPIVPGSFCGTALTVRTVPRDNLAPWAALSVAKPGDVLVVAAGSDDVSVMGDVLIGMARNAGIVAVVTDGLVRDIAGLEAVGIPVLARGLSPNSPFKNGPGEVGGSVSIGGVVVSPGDVVLGDRDGAVVVPASRIGEVVGKLDAIKAKERKMESAVEGGDTAPEWLASRLDGGDVIYVD
ncbi:MAG: hypothetical protein CL535_18250 [Ahrensia sp.]|nr:hypothetical protein [Ahrensia sp.]